MEFLASLVQSNFTCEYINNSRTRTLLLECASHVWFMDKSEAFRSLESSFVAGNIIKKNLRRSTGAAHQHCAAFTHFNNLRRRPLEDTEQNKNMENRTEFLLINLKWHSVLMDLKRRKCFPSIVVWLKKKIAIFVTVERIFGKISKMHHALVTWRQQFYLISFSMRAS